jgi:hypothetical protein
MVKKQTNIDNKGCKNKTIIPSITSIKVLVIHSSFLIDMHDFD